MQSKEKSFVQEIQELMLRVNSHPTSRINNAILIGLDRILLDIEAIESERTNEPRV